MTPPIFTDQSGLKHEIQFIQLQSIFNIMKHKNPVSLERLELSIITLEV